jgi:hypothetical protein
MLINVFLIRDLFNLLHLLMTPPKEEGAEEPTHKQEESTIT